MNQTFARRSFLQAFGAVMATAPELLAQQAGPATTGGTGVRVQHGHDRFDARPSTGGISQFQVKVSGKDTAKRLLIRKRWRSTVSSL